jgi:hypothetical protein
MIVIGPASAFDSGLAPVIDEELGVTGVRPEGWAEYPPRVYRRAPGTSDLTTFVLRRCGQGLTPDEAIAAVPTYGAELEPAGCCTTDWCAWDLYRAESSVWGCGRLVIEVALATTDRGTYVMLLQATPPEFDQLRAEVFEPALRALAPVAPPAPAESDPRVPEPLAEAF